MKKLFIASCLLTIALSGFAQSQPELAYITGKIYFNTKYVLLNNLINVMGTNETSMINDEKDKTGGRSYSISIPKNTDVYLIINKKYVTKINSANKKYDINLYDGEKDQTKTYLAEWNKNKELNESFFKKTYAGRFNSKAMYENDEGITISTPVGETYTEKKIDFENDVFDFVTIEKSPQFPGGMINFNDYIQKNLKYPEVAKENNFQGKVFASFIVERDGSLTNIQITRGLSAEIDKEAIRLIKSSPKWEPGVQHGKKVRCNYNVPVTFKLN